jgi:hypothetical protein
MYEGNWKFARLEKWRRKHWQQCYEKDAAYDDELEQQDLSIDDLRNELKALRGELRGMIPAMTPPQEQNFDSFLGTLRKNLADFEALSSTTLQTHLNDARNFRAQIIPTLAAAQASQVNPWEQRRQKIYSITSLLDSIYPYIGEKRERFKRNFFLYFPPERHDVMPTRLGNVLKTVEVRTWKKYHLDAVLIWSRLQSNLPKEFAQTLQDSKTSLDMMVTLSSFVLFFGTILAAVMAYNLSLGRVAIAPLVLVAAVPLIARFSFHLSRRAIIITTIVALLLLLVVPLVSIYIMLRKGFWSPLVWFGNTALRVEFFLVLMVGICLLSWVIYLNSVQAGLAYAEKIQASFDLYRWKVFEGLNLQLPPSFQEERAMWKQLCALLSSSKEPDANYYSYVKQQQTKELARPSAKVKLPVLKEDKPAFHLIGNEDLVEKEVLASKVTADVARARGELTGKLSLQQLSAHHPISRSLVTDAQNLEHTVSVGIQVTQSSIMGGNLQIGDVVEVIIVPAPTETDSLPDPVIFDGVRVLDIKQVAGSQNFVVVIALPSNRRIKFAALSFGSNLLITRKTLA